ISVPAIGSIALNITVWIAARGGCHIGASGLIYLLAAYLASMAIFSKRKNIAAFVLIIVFLYGSMVWGILPGKPGVSWESHLFGALWGIILAIYYKRDKTWNEIYYPEPTLEDEDDTPDFELNEIENTIESNSQDYKNSSAPHWMNAKEIHYSNDNKSDNKKGEEYE
ncbi:MAG: rhomboid family intramembrane serine protease, partial [Salinivirgaceae bacterium]|nr:rhomboid family intramembrane serine protease [Salinivirgaceae bacterium]